MARRQDKHKVDESRRLEAGERIMALRKALYPGTQENFRKLILINGKPIGRSTYGDIERGAEKSIDISHYIGIARVLHIDTKEIDPRSNSYTPIESLIIDAQQRKRINQQANEPKEPTESQWIGISAFAQKLKGLTHEQQQVEMHNQPPEVADLMPYVAKYRDLSLELDRDRSGEQVGDFKLDKRIGFGGNIPHLSPHFTERPALMESIRCKFTTEGSDRKTRLTALLNYGGNGKTVAAILYAHRSVDSYPGGRFFLNLSEVGFAESFKQLAPLLGIKTEEPTRTKDESENGKLVKTRLENGERSLLVLDNIDTLTNWQEIVASGLLPNTGCDVLITTRLDSIPHAAIVPVTRLDEVETLDVLTRFCRGAASKNKGGRIGPSESEAASIHVLLGGLALAIAAVGAFMKRNTHVSWEKYCQNLRDLRVDQLPDASETVRAELGLEFNSLPEHKRSLRVIDDTLDALVPREIRAIEYAALMAEDRVLRSWLEILIESDRSVDGGPVADSSDPTPEHARIVEGLIDSDLLVALANTSVGPQLSLHRLFRLRAVERAEKKGTLWDLVLGLAKFLDKKADSTYFDGYVSSMDLAELDNYPSLINRMVGLGMIDFAKQLAAKVYNQANAVFRPNELRQVFYELIELINMTPADSLTLADAAMLMRAARDWHIHRDSQKSREWAKQAYDICLRRGAQIPIQQAEFAYDYANILYKQDCPETAWQVLTDNLPKIWDEDHGPQDNLLREYVGLALSVRPRSTPVDDNLIQSRAAQLEYQEYKGDADIKDFFSLASSVFFHAHQLVWAKAALSVQMAKFKHLIGVEDVEYAKFLYQMAYIETERGRHDSARSHIKEAEKIGLAAARRLHEEDLSSGEPFPLFLENQTFRLDEAKINSVDQYLCKWFKYPNNLGTGRWYEWSSKLLRRKFLN